MGIPNFPSNAVFHAKRFLRWRLVDVMPTDHEMEKLDEADITTNEVVRVFMVWRRSALIGAIPLLLFSAVLDAVSISRSSSDGSYEGRHAFGRFAVVLPELTSLILLISAVFALYWWRSTQRSIRLLGWAWILALIIPLWPALVPTDAFYEKDFRTEEDLYGFITRISDAVTYAVQLLPLIISIPQGIIQGSLRVRGLLPSSSLAGWVIVLTAPFASLLMFASLLLLVQLAGNWLLVTGVLLLSVSPSLYVLYRKLYTHATTKEEEIKLGRAQLAIGLTRMLGFLFLMIWALTYEKYGIRIIGKQSDNDDDGDNDGDGGNVDNGVNDGDGGNVDDGVNDEPVVLLPWTMVVSLFLESFGRTILTILVVADAVLHMTLVDWKTNLERQTENSDAQKKELHKLVVVRANPKDKEHNDREKDRTREEEDEEQGKSETAAADEGAGADE